MKLNRKVGRDRAAPWWLAAGGVGIAYAVGGDESEESVSGPTPSRRRAAALDAVGGGTVTRDRAPGRRRRGRLRGRGASAPTARRSRSTSTAITTRSAPRPTTTRVPGGRGERGRRRGRGRGLRSSRGSGGTEIRTSFAGLRCSTTSPRRRGPRRSPHDRQSPRPAPPPVRPSSARVKRSKARLLEVRREAAALVGDLEHAAAPSPSALRAAPRRAPWRSALSTRLPSACSIRSGSSVGAQVRGAASTRELAAASPRRAVANRSATRSSSGREPRPARA